MLNALQEQATRWPEGALHFEYFGATSTGLDPEKEHAFDVHLKDTDITVHVDASTTLHDALNAAGVDIPLDCGEGLCGTC